MTLCVASGFCCKSVGAYIVKITGFVAKVWIHTQITGFVAEGWVHSQITGFVAKVCVHSQVTGFVAKVWVHSQIKQRECLFIVDMAGPSSDEGDDDDAVARGRHDEEDAQQYDSDKDVDLLRALSPADDSASERLFARTDHDRRAATPRLAPPVANGSSSSSSGSRSTSGAGRSSRFLTTSVAKSHRCDYSPDPSQHTSSTHSWSSPRSHSSSSRSSHSSRRPSSRISRSSSRSPSSSSLRQSRSTRATRTYGHSPSRSPVHPSYSPFAGSHASKNLVQEVEQKYHELQRRESQRRSM